MASPRFGTDHLRDRALLALEEAVQETRYRPARRTFALRFSFAYLWASSSADRKVFDDLWRALGAGKSPWNFSVADGALNAVYRALGIPRDDEISWKLWRRFTAEEGHGGGRH